MTRFLIIAVLIIFSFSSCQNYKSEEYIEMEKVAISDIILELTQFEKIKNSNQWENEKFKLYLISELGISTARTIKPTGYNIGENGIDYSKEKIEENKKEFERELEKYEYEEKLFAKLKKGKISKRKLNSSFENDFLEIELIDSEKIRELESFKTKKNELGYLSISRIIFNRDLNKGYLHFDFICGEGCAWDNNIEIKKINGKWKITKYFSGGIA